MFSEHSPHLHFKQYGATTCGAAAIIIILANLNITLRSHIFRGTSSETLYLQYFSGQTGGRLLRVRDLLLKQPKMISELEEVIFSFSHFRSHARFAADIECEFGSWPTKVFEFIQKIFGDFACRGRRTIYSMEAMNSIMMNSYFQSIPYFPAYVEEIEALKTWPMIEIGFPTHGEVRLALVAIKVSGDNAVLHWIVKWADGRISDPNLSNEFLLQNMAQYSYIDLAYIDIKIP